MVRLDPEALLIALAALVVLWILKKRGFFNAASPALLYSNLKAIKSSKTFSLSWVQLALFSSGFFLLLFAFLNPHTVSEVNEKNPPPVEGRALFLLIDQSGSMGASGGVRMVNGELIKQSKLERLKEIAKPFILSRKGDLLGLVSFARGATVLSPLSLSTQDLIEKLDGIEVITKDDENGTAIGYALYKTAHLISEYAGASTYKIHQPVMIVLTDGLQDPNPLDFGNTYRTMGLEEAATFAKQKGIRLYMINFEPKITEEKFKPNLHEMERAVQLTGGKLLLVSDLDHVVNALSEINSIEKSQFDAPEYEMRTFTHSYFPPFAVAGLLCMLCFIFAGETVFRRIP